MTSQQDKATLDVDGQTYVLRMSLGAVEAVEDHFDRPLSELGDILNERIRARDFRVLLQAFCAGGGTPISDDAVARVDYSQAAEAIVRMTGADAAPEKPAGAASGKRPARRRGAAGVK